MSDYDVIVIGSGPGGYVCAIKCAQLGLKTACIEGAKTLGGTCLNIGCIPSKALLHATHQLNEAQHNFSLMGLIAEPPKVDLQKMMEYKGKVVEQNTKGLEFLFKKNKIAWIKGWATVVSNKKVQVGDKIYLSKNIVLASGSTPSSLPNVKIDENIIVSSTGALSPKKIPEKLIIIGAGVIGLELGSVYARLGSQVKVIEFSKTIVPSLDSDLQTHLKRILTKQGISFELDSAVQRVKISKNKANVEYLKTQEKTLHSDEADMVLVATGRSAYTEGLGLKNLNIEFTKNKKILTNAFWRTTAEGVYAIGDAIEGPMLAHKAEDEGIAVAEIISGKLGHVNYLTIPSVIYTHPEVATVGHTEDDLKANGVTYKIGKFNFAGNGRAKAMFASEGFVKILANIDTDRILGAHIIGPMAGDLIHEICVAMEFGASAEDLARTCHAHPTVSEAVREAALACGSGAIHA
jgi:dihydrolipoamide dehydrogenase